MFKKILITIVRGYQRFISPLFPPSCRYYPTCSHYTVEAIEKHGAFKGGIMGVARILRCNPFVQGGVDHVPNHFTIRRNPDEKNLLYGLNLDAPEDTIERNKQIEELYEKYKADVIVYNERPSAVDVLKGIVDIEEKSLELLPQEYLKELKNSMTSESSSTKNTVNFQFVEVLRNERSEQYFGELDLHTVIAHALFDKGHEERIGVLLEEEEGIVETNSFLLYRAFKKEYGMTEEELETKDQALFDYLLLLQEEKDGISAEEWLEKREEEKKAKNYEG